MRNLVGYTIAFDLDGTLVETAPDLHRALAVVMRAQGLPPASLDEVRVFVGQGARVLILRALGEHGRTPGEAELDALTADFITAYSADIAALSRPFPGVEDALDRLAGMGARLCVCTNKRTDLSVQLLDALKLSSRFEAIVGADSVPEKKPHAGHFIAAVRAAGGEPEQALMIGDSIADVGTAKAAGAPVALVSFGYTDTAPELLGADAVFTQYADLPDLALRLLGSHPIPRM